MWSNFDLKQFYDECPKILNEFKKRIDPDLPFFYWAGAKQRYTEFDLPSNKILTKTKHNDQFLSHTK